MSVGRTILDGIAFVVALGKMLMPTPRPRPPLKPREDLGSVRDEAATLDFVCPRCAERFAPATMHRCGPRGQV